MADKRSLQGLITRWLMRISPDYDAQAEAAMRRRSEQVIAHAQKQRDRANAVLDAYIREQQLIVRKRQ